VAEPSAAAPVLDGLTSLDEMARYELFLRVYRSEEKEDRRALETALLGEDPMLKMQCLQYLEEIPESRAVRLILPLLRDDNDIIQESAQRAFKKNGCSRKHRLLRPLVMDEDLAVACYAIRVLSRQGDRDVISPLLALLEDAEGELLHELLAALRLLTDPRSVARLLRFADAPEEKTRYLAVRALAAVKADGCAVAVEVFLKAVQDDSDRVRRTAVLGLQRFPSSAVADTLLKKALSETDPVENRRRAILALGALPGEDRIRPLVGLMAADPKGPLRLASEISLRRFPPAMLKHGLLAILDSGDAALGQKAALILAETHGEDPEVRSRLLRSWEAAGSGPEKMAALEILGELGGQDVVPLLIEIMKADPVLGYVAATHLGRIFSREDDSRVLGLLQKEDIPQYVKQAMLSALLRRGRSESIAGPLLEWILKGMKEEVLNIRYLSVQIAAWYPLKDTLPSLLELIAVEADRTVMETAEDIILGKLGGNPVTLVAAVRGFKGFKKILPSLVRILGLERWDGDRGYDLLYGLMIPPIELPRSSPTDFTALCIRLLESGSLSMEKIWLFLPGEAQRRRFLEGIRDAMADGKRAFPPVPLDFLSFHLAGSGPKERALFYELAGRSMQPEGVAMLTSAVLKERSGGPLDSAREGLRRLLREASA